MLSKGVGSYRGGADGTGGVINGVSAHSGYYAPNHRFAVQNQISMESDPETHITEVRRSPRIRSRWVILYGFRFRAWKPGRAGRSANADRCGSSESIAHC